MCLMILKCVHAESRFVILVILCDYLSNNRKDRTNVSKFKEMIIILSVNLIYQIFCISRNSAESDIFEVLYRDEHIKKRYFYIVERHFFIFSLFAHNFL